MRIDYIVVGIYQENTFFLIDDREKTCILVDPGGSGKEIEKYLQTNNLKPLCIICTHGHPDHVEANHYIKIKYDISVKLHPTDAELFGVPFDEPLADGDKIDFAGEVIEIWETPGHTMGSLCLATGKFILTGDTLFKGAMGRTDLGGDMAVMMKTLSGLYDRIPDEMVLYPGHGPETTMGHEKKHNPFLLEAKTISSP